MTSEPVAAPLREAYVWAWLPGQAAPIVAGRLAPTPEGLQFNYGRGYLARKDAIALYLPELPLRAGVLPLPTGLSMPGCLRDAAPDAWGRRVILHRLLGQQARDADTAVLDELRYLLESGSDRIGALDFQASATDYVARESGATLSELMSSAARVEQGLPLSPALAQALQHGTAIGGARPKATLTDGPRKLIAKFSSSTDVYPVVKAEFLAMRLAADAGLDVAPVELVQVAGKDVLLVERFDRVWHADGDWRRRALVSALTLLGLDEMLAAYASYEDLAEIIRHRFSAPRASLRELFARLVFNILCGNTDDHARNHAAFWDGQALALTPAYDICPQLRAGQEATQAMKIQGAQRFSQFAACVDAAAQFQLSAEDARGIIDAQLQAVRMHWDIACDAARLRETERNALWGRQFLNPFALHGYADA